MSRKSLGAMASTAADLVTLGESVALVGRKLYKPGQVMLPVGIAGILPNASAWIAGTARSLPFAIDRPITVDRIGLRVVTAQAGATFQFAIYTSDQYGALAPGKDPIYLSGSLSAAAAGAVSAFISGGGLPFAAGVYWIVVHCDTAGVVFGGFPAGWWVVSSVIGSANLASGSSGGFYFSGAATFGSFVQNPTLSENASTGNAVPCPHWRIV